MRCRDAGALYVSASPRPRRTTTMRPNPATWILSAAATAALAVPALAAVPAEPGQARDAVFPGLRDATAAAEALARQAKREARRERRGPVHPVASRPDYGSSEAAFGASRTGHTHAGQDVFAPAGTPLVAVAKGVIAETGSDGGQGNYAYLYDPRADRTYVYMHLVEPSPVKPGERVRAGQRLGGVGCTGSCWGDHLHFEIRAGRGIEGEPVDPLPLLRRWERTGM